MIYSEVVFQIFLFLYCYYNNIDSYQIKNMFFCDFIFFAENLPNYFFQNVKMILTFKSNTQSLRLYARQLNGCILAY